MDPSNNNHDHYYGNHDDQYDNYRLFPLLTDDVNTNQSSQNSPAFANHNLPHAVIPSTFHTFHDQAPRNNSEVANVNDETAVDVKVAKVGPSSVKKRKRKNAKPALPKPNHNKAINFPISSLEIGSWKRQARHNEDLIARCYFSKKTLAWEVLDEENCKNKLEFSFSDIDAINSVITPENGLLYIRLKNRPAFRHDVNKQPKRHTSWQDRVDFTGGEATRTRVHKLEIDPRNLRKHYNNIIKHDNKLLELSKKKFPEKESSLFDDVYRDPYINSMNNSLCTLPELPSNFGVPPQLPLTPQGYGINPINAISIQHTESGRNWPEGNISNNNYANHDYPTRNYSIDVLYPSQVYGGNSNNQHLGSTVSPLLPPLNYTINNAHDRPQEWAPLVYPGLGTTTPAPALNDENVSVPAHAHAHANARLIDFSSNTSVDLMQIQLRYLQQHGSSYNNNQLQSQASINHDVAHLANQSRRSNNN